MKACKGQLLHLTAILVLASAMMGCASSTRERLEARQDQGHPRAAAYGAEGFTMDFRSPEPRPYRAWEFYYKNCVLVSRNPYPSRADYECADPH